MALAAHNFTIQDDAGNIVPDVDIEVRLDTAGQPLVQLFSDRDGLSALGNPFTSATGAGRFHVAGGAYQIRAFKDGFEAIQRYVGIGTARELDIDDLEDLIPAIPETAFAYYASLSAALAEDLSNFEVIYVGGYAGEGDGGAALWLNRTTNEPAHGAKRQDSAGNWFELGEDRPTPVMLGADRTFTNGSSTALQEWLEFVITQGLDGYIPAGRYLIDTLVTYNITARTRFTIRGAGTEATRITCADDNADGGIVITTNSGDPGKSHCMVRDFWIEPLNESGGGTGFGFNPGGVGIEQTGSLVAENVYIGAASGGLGYFNDAWDMTGCRRPRLTNCQGVGLSGPDVANIERTITSFADSGGDLRLGVSTHGRLTGDTAVYNANGGTPPTGLTDGQTVYLEAVTLNFLHLYASANDFLAGTNIPFTDAGSGSAHTLTFDDNSDTSDKFKMDNAFILDNTYQATLIDCRAISAATAFKCHGTSQEAGRFFFPIVTGCKVGIDWVRSTSQPGLQIIGGQFNCRDKNLSLDGVDQGYISGVAFFTLGAAEWAASAPVDVYMTNCQDINCTDNCHEGICDPRRYAYQCGDAASAVSISISSPNFSDRLRLAAIVHAGHASSDRIVVLNPLRAASINAITARVTGAGAAGVKWIAYGEEGNNILAVSPSKALSGGGDAGQGITLGAGQVGVYAGSGAPTLSASKGSLYLRTNGSGTSDRAYINTDGGTTWTAITTAA